MAGGTTACNQALTNQVAHLLWLFTQNRKRKACLPPSGSVACSTVPCCSSRNGRCASAWPCSGGCVELEGWAAARVSSAGSGSHRGAARPAERPALCEPSSVPASAHLGDDQAARAVGVAGSEHLQARMGRQRRRIPASSGDRGGGGGEAQRWRPGRRTFSNRMLPPMPLRAALALSAS